MRKKTLLSIAVILFITGGILAPVFELIVSVATPVAFAQEQTDIDGNTTSSTSSEGTNVSVSEKEALDAAAKKDAETAAAVATKSDVLDCGVNVLCGLVQLIGLIFTFTSNLIATVGGLIADYSLWFSIQNSSYGAVNGFIENGWKIVRDITNLLFIFALFSIAFVLILGLEEQADSSVRLNPKRTFGYIIIMALLVNFSFFMTRTLIEVGNISAMFIYKSINSPVANTVDNAVAAGQGSNGVVSQLGSPSTWFNPDVFPGMKSISLELLNKVNPQQLILDNSKIESSNWVFKSYDWSFYILYIFLAIITAIFNLTLTYIFISMTFLFIGRYIGLLFAVIISPLAFVSTIIPSLKKQDYIGFDDWLSELVGLTFVAPVYIFFLYLTILFLKTDFGFLADGGYLIIAATILIKLALVALVLLRGKSLAVSMSGHIGKMASGVINTAAMFGVGLATGGTGMLMSQTFGRAGAAIGKSGTLQRISQGGAAMDIDSVAKRQSMANSIRKFGFAKYNPLAKKLAGSVENGNLSIGAMQAKAAGGLRNFGKNMATFNPLDVGVGGITARTGAANLAKKTGNDGFARGLAQDYVKDIKKNMAMNRMMDIEASKNAKKTLTNTIGGAMTSGLNSGNQSGGGSSTNGTGSGPVTVTGPNTGPIPPNGAPVSTTPSNSGGGTPSRPERTGPTSTFNNNVDFDRPKTSSGLVDQYGNPISSNPNATQKEESGKLTGIYNREQQAKGESISVENLTVKNLNIEEQSGKEKPVVLPSRESSSGISPQKQALTFLSSIQTPPKAPASGALNYKATNFAPNTKPVSSTKSSPIVDQYNNPVTSQSTPHFEEYKKLSHEYTTTTDLATKASLKEKMDGLLDKHYEERSGGTKQ